MYNSKRQPAAFSEATGIFIALPPWKNSGHRRSPEHAAAARIQPGPPEVAAPAAAERWRRRNAFHLAAELFHILLPMSTVAALSIWRSNPSAAMRQSSQLGEQRAQALLLRLGRVRQRCADERDGHHASRQVRRRAQPLFLCQRVHRLRSRNAVL